MRPSDPLLLNGCCWLAWSAYWLIAARFVNRAKASEGLLTRLTHLLPATAGFVLIFHGGPRAWIYGRLIQTTWVAWLGLGLTVAGLLIAVWARVHLGKYWSGVITVKEGHELIRTGPYRFVRHPIYSGFLLAVVGSTLSARTGDAVFGLAIIGATYLVKVKREETVLSREFGEQYLRFRHEVAALCPFLY